MSSDMIIKTKIQQKKNNNVLYGYMYGCIVYIKTDIYKDIAETAETRFDTLNYALERS